MTDPKLFTKAISDLFRHHRVELTDTAVMVYAAALKDATDDQAVKAILFGFNSERMPTPHSLASHIGLVPSTDYKARAAAAWVEVDAVMTNSGNADRPVSFRDVLCNATIRSLGGWSRLMTMGESEFDKWARVEFIKRYEAYCHNPPPASQCSPLSGNGLVAGTDLPALPHLEEATVSARLTELDNALEDKSPKQRSPEQGVRGVRATDSDYIPMVDRLAAKLRPAGETENDPEAIRNQLAELASEEKSNE